MLYRPIFCRNNKKGSALALVIIIAAGLIALVSALYTMAQSSIATADSGIKSREAYLSAKSGIEFVKSCVAETILSAQSHLDSQIAIKNSDHDHVVSLDDEIFYGYGNLTDGFAMNAGITEDSSAYKNARIKIVYSVEHQLHFTETNETTGAGTYTDTITITAASTGKSPEASSFTDILEKGITLSFEYQDEITGYYSGSSGSIGVIPDTGGDGSPGIPVTDEWPTEESDPGSGGSVISGNSTFIYNGNAYYVVMYNTWITVGTHPSDYPHILLINPGPARDIGGWDGVPPYNNKSMESFNLWLHQRDGGPDIQRGDKVVYNGIYYLLRDDPTTISWVNAPPGYPWFVIPNQ